jgi:hypothetical protein
MARLLEIDRSAARDHLLLLIWLGLIAHPTLAEGFVLTDKGRHYMLKDFSAATLDIPPSAAAVLEDSDIVNSIKKLINKSGAPAPPLNSAG